MPFRHHQNVAMVPHERGHDVKRLLQRAEIAQVMGEAARASLGSGDDGAGSRIERRALLDAEDSAIDGQRHGAGSRPPRD
jgi:hypothetical protein